MTRFTNVLTEGWINLKASGVNAVPQEIFCVNDKYVMWRGGNRKGNQWHTYGYINQRSASAIEVTKIAKATFEELTGMGYQRVLLEARLANDGIYEVYNLATWGDLSGVKGGANGL